MRYMTHMNSHKLCVHTMACITDLGLSLGRAEGSGGT